MPLLFAPTIGGALASRHHFLWVYCPACRTTRDVDLRTLDRHRDAAVTSPTASLSVARADLIRHSPDVLALAGAAREHPFVLAFGLLLSIALMGVAANLINRLLQEHRWIAYLGLAIILYVACEMIYRGAYELKPMIGAVGFPSYWSTP